MDTGRLNFEGCLRHQTFAVLSCWPGFLLKPGKADEINNYLLASEERLD